MQRTHRRRQTYDHRLRDAIAATGNPYLFHDVAIPRSTRRTWARGDFHPVVASVDVELEFYELLERVDKLRQRATRELLMDASGSSSDAAANASVFVVTDRGSENFGEVEKLLEDSNSLSRVLAQVDIVCSNSD